MRETFKSFDIENISLKELEIEKAIAESKKNKDVLKSAISQWIINKLVSEEWYTVKQNDILSLINKLTLKWNHINFNNEADKIFVWDKIKIKEGKVYKNNETIWVVSEWFKKINNSEAEKVVEKINKQETEDKDAYKKSPMYVEEEKNEDIDWYKKSPMYVEEEKNDTISNDPIDNLIKDIAKKTENIEADGKEKKESVSFKIDEKKLDELNNLIKENWLNLDLNQFLNSYKTYIENNLVWKINKKHLEKIIESISYKFNEISKIINERIAWVDEQIEEWDYKKEDREKEIQNQRWIINSKFQDIFSEINNKVIPASLILTKNTSSSYVDKVLEAKDMFNADVLEDWEFDKTWKSGEIWDANVNNWNTFDLSEERDAKFLKSHGIEWMKELPNLLNEKDSKIEENATIAYFSYVFISMIPYLWAWLSIPADLTDLFSDEEWVIKILRWMWIVNEDYRMEKSMLDNILGWVWLLLTAFWIQSIAKWWKIIKNGSKLDKIWVWKLEDWLVSMWKKLGLSQEKINGALDLFRKSKKIEQKKTVDNINNLEESKKLLSELKEKHKKTLWRFVTKEDRKKYWMEVNSRNKDLIKKIEDQIKEIETNPKSFKENKYSKVSEENSKNNKLKNKTDESSETIKNNKTEISEKAKKFVSSNPSMKKRIEARKKEINTAFEKEFNKNISEGKSFNTIIDNKEVQISLKDWDYRISWDSKIYESKSEILDKISYKTKKDLLINKSKNIKFESPLKIKDWFFDFKWKYKVSKDEIIINENWAKRVLSKVEEEKFYNKYWIELLEKHTWAKFWETIVSLWKKLKKLINSEKSWEKGKIRKAADGVANWTWDQITSPHLVIKEFKKAKWFSESAKAILFWNHQKAWLLWDNVWWIPVTWFINSWVWKMAWNMTLAAFLWWAVVEKNDSAIFQDSEKVNWANILLNYAELMYLPVLWIWAIEMLDLDSFIVWD